MRVLWVFFVVLSLGCQEKKKFHDTKESIVIKGKTEVLTEILEFQNKMNLDFKDPEVSPLYNRHRKDFEGLDFFEPDTTFRVIGKLIKTPEALPFQMPMTINTESEYKKYGMVYFSIKNVTYQLEIYQDQLLFTQEKYKDHLFLPFTDLTNGKQTYTGGRYIDLKIPEGDSILIDFNKSYNPYCAYNKKYACPIVPEVNNLRLAVSAGVKAFKN
ncbi:MAG: DUF1684 domain-containing protein [Cellulophaga sp.]|nr:DUF1684 domain-containing protein [Cellulophaga sp.]MDP5231796.1 DUF1684 domain-containing protein [Cellulophaga sp.]